MKHPPEPPLAPETRALHVDQDLDVLPDVAPPLRLSATYRADNAEGLIYARAEHPTRRRVERILGNLEGGHAVTYASGQAAVTAALHRFCPRRIAVDRGYYETHRAFHALAEPGPELLDLDVAPREGDLVWLETPKNPTCDIEDIAFHAERAHRGGAVVVVDSTLATPVLQHPLALGADAVVHSTTKFIAGHSDAVGGVLIVPAEETAAALREARTTAGSIPGVLETWLTLRSLRTLCLRVERQDATASRLAAWLEGNVPRVWHPSLESHPGHALAAVQMRGGGGVLSFEMEDEEKARALPSRLRLFQDATSMGGVESLIEWRHKHDPATSPKLLRISAGLESPEDLIADLEAALRR